MKTETIMKLWMGALFASVVVAVVWNIVVEVTH
jgi:hypothetical protein